MILFATHAGRQKKAGAVYNTRPVIFNVSPLCPAVNTDMGIVPLNDNRYKFEVKFHYYTVIHFPR